MLITSPCLEISSISSYYRWFNTCSNFHSSYPLNIFPSGPLRWVCRTEILTHLIPLYAGISFILCTGNTRSIVGVTDLPEPRVAWVRPRFSESYFRLVHLSNLISHRFLLPTLYDRRYHWEGKIDGHQREDGIDADIVLSWLASFD